VPKVSACRGSHVDVGVLSARKNGLKFSFLKPLVCLLLLCRFKISLLSLIAFFQLVKKKDGIVKE
jgi:hypothetical protein